MSSSVSVCLFRAGDHCAPVSVPYDPLIRLKGSLQGLCYGANGLFVSEHGFYVEAIETSKGWVSDFEPFIYEFRYFNPHQRANSERANEALKALLVKAGINDLPPTTALVPMVVSVLDNGIENFYRYMQQGNSGAVFLSYHIDAAAQAPSWSLLVRQLQAGFTKLKTAWPLLNDDCWYSKWLPEMEIERKFTFSKIEDTWALNCRLYNEILGGQLTGFFPELDREFQVFDYESHIFEVVGEPDEQGYISFIPQADGKVTLKRKWFTENAEIRRETLEANQTIALTDFAQHAASLTTAKTRQLPTFRRKRFDVNFESLATGNIYGVYFDICRTHHPETAFSQCEVEYCRTRTFSDLNNVMEEFELIAGYVEKFLARNNIEYASDLYSKLDFVRQADSINSLALEN
ncbi:hypothetical protein KV580_13490 [Pseudomonas chlororaphis]|nr:hypothetical protein [Pseudomonas chlororaphis]